MNLNRNDLCWCGSGLKYKKCHIEFDKKLDMLQEQGFLTPPRQLIKTKEQIEGIKKSAKINNAVLDLVAENIKEGMSTEEIDKLVHTILYPKEQFQLLLTLKDILKVFALQ